MVSARNRGVACDAHFWVMRCRSGNDWGPTDPHESNAKAWKSHPSRLQGISYLVHLAVSFRLRKDSFKERFGFFRCEWGFGRLGGVGDGDINRQMPAILP